MTPIDTNSDIDRDIEWILADQQETLNKLLLKKRITQLLITERQRTCGLIEAEMPKKKTGLKLQTAEQQWRTRKKEGFNDALDQTLAVIRRHRLASSRKDGSSPETKLDNNAPGVEEK